MKAILLAAGSALCALSCIVQVIAGIALLFINWRVGLPLLVFGVVCALAARALDRAKMRAIYGPELGERLADDDAPGVSSTELAARDAANWRRSNGKEPTGDRCGL